MLVTTNGARRVPPHSVLLAAGSVTSPSAGPAIEYSASPRVWHQQVTLCGAQARPHGQQDRYNQKNRNVGLRRLKLSDRGFRRRIKCFCVEMNEVGHRASTLKVVLSLEPCPFKKGAAGVE